MKKSALPAALLLLGVLLSGCPIYESDDANCFSDVDCDYGAVCDGHTNRCVSTAPASLTCHRPEDCDSNETCSRVGTCSSSDCSFTSVGCVRGYQCSSASGRWECVTADSLGSNGGEPSSGGEPGTNNGGGEPGTNGGERATAGGAG